MNHSFFPGLRARRILDCFLAYFTGAVFLSLGAYAGGFAGVVGLAHPACEPAASQADDKKLMPLAEALAGYRAQQEGQENKVDPRPALESAWAAQSKAGAKNDRATHWQRALWLAQLMDAKKFKPGKILEENHAGGSFGKSGLDYAFRTPRDYETGGKGYPLIISLPDADQKPAAHLREAWRHRDLLDGAILMSPAMPEDVAVWHEVMQKGRPAGLCHVLTVLRLATERFAVDPDRIFVVGRGNGVPAAFATAAFGPQRLAGVIGLGGNPGELGPESIAHLPSLFVGGGAEAREFFEGAEAMDDVPCEWQISLPEADLWKWMGEQTRNPYPEKLLLHTGTLKNTPFPTRGYWLRLTPIAPGAMAKAEWDKEKNTIRISGEGASHASLYLSEAHLDPKRPLTVVCNGVENVVQPRASLGTTLGLISDGTSDPGCVYTIELTFDFSGKAAGAQGQEVAEADPELSTHVTEAGEDVAKLWLVVEWCEANERTEKAQPILRKIVRLDPNHAEARKRLGHVPSAVGWFTSPHALGRYMASQDEGLAQAKGHVLHKGLWMNKNERRMANQGQKKDPESGMWLTLAEQKRVAQGWIRQDTQWFDPSEGERLDAGLWWVDGEWLPLEEANRSRAKLDRMWVLPSPSVWVHTSCDRVTGLHAQAVMESALWDLNRVFGAEPALPLHTALLRDQEQYDRLAFGDPDGRRLAGHAGRLHLVHHAYFAESRFVVNGRKREFGGLGVGYWETHAPYGGSYGVHSARLAVGLAYVEALDPSPKAVAKAQRKRDIPSDYFDEYQAEKRMPAWLRYGGAVYAERYFIDRTIPMPAAGEEVAEGAGDPFWARKWSLEALQSRGGLRPLDEVFAFALDPDDAPHSQKLYIEAGLLVSYLVDGPSQAAQEALAEFRSALLEDRMKPSDWRALEDVLRAEEAELRAYAGEE